MTTDNAVSLEHQADTQTQPLAKGNVRLVSLCFFLSGLAALLYQTAWMRQFATVFGTSEPAVAAVLAAYMSGLALGAAAAGRWLTHIRRPILVYGLLELGIAMGAIALPVGLHLARAIVQKYTGGLAELPDAGGGGQFALYLAATFLLVLIPTSFMGATLPLLVRHAVRRESEIGSRIGGLYAINTVGAVFGTLVAAFVLLPRVGLQATVWIGVGINALVFLLAVLVAQRNGVPSSDTQTKVRKSKTFSIILPLMAFSGAIAFTYEVLWTRLLGHLLGGSLYAFATMLASFLTGIAIGSAFAARRATTKERALYGLAAAQFGIAICSIVIYSGLDLLPSFQRLLDVGEDAGLGQNALLAALVLLPSTLCLGATFPFAVRIVAGSAAEAGSASARVFSWNTIGATVGALAAGFLILPALQFEGAIRLCVLGNVVLAIVVYFMSESSDLRGKLTALGGFALVVAFFQPSAPMAVLTASPFAELSDSRNVVWSRVGSSCSAVVVEKGDQYQLRVNGLPQSLIARRGAAPFGGTQSRWLTALPLLARPDAKRVCVIGLGGGVAVEGLPQSVEEIDVLELSHEVVEANEFLSELRNSDPLADPRVNVVENDARSAFARSTKRWDVVVSQPSHPWTAGASHLFTREFAQLVHEHLVQDGVFLQWVSTRSFNMDLLKTYGATLLAEFEYVRLYQSSNDCPLFLASDEPIAIEEDLLSDRGLLDSAPEYVAWLGIGQPEDLAARLTLDTKALRQFCEGAVPNTDDANLLALRPPSMGAQSAWAEVERKLAPLADRELDSRFDKIQVVRALLRLDFVQRAETVAAQLEDLGQRAYAEFLIAKRAANYKLALTKLHQAFDLDPDDPSIAYDMVAAEHGRDASPRGKQARLHLTSGAMAAAEAWPHFVAGEWSELEQFESELARAEPKDPWYFFALQIRAICRVQGDPAAESAQLRAREAIELADRAIAIGPNASVLAIRVQAAARINDADMAIESAALLAKILNQLPNSVLNRRYASSVVPSLVQLQGDERVDASRLSGLLLQFLTTNQPGLKNSAGQPK